MITRVLEGIVTAMSSISHIGDTFGIVSKFRREQMAMPTGIEEIPIVSGNAMRGNLRDIGMYHMLRTLGYGISEDDLKIKDLGPFHFLFSGGSLTKTKTRGVDIGLARKWRETIPLISLFGGALGNQIMPGKMKIGKLIPICLETESKIPTRIFNRSYLKDVSVFDLLQEEAYTRKDDEKNDNLRVLMDKTTLFLLDQARVNQVDEKSLSTQSQQMRYFVETLIAGTQFYWKIVLQDVTDVEFDAFATTLAQFSKNPYIGGKSSIGLGEISMQFEQWMEVDPRIKTGNEVSFTYGQFYKNHLRDNGGKIKELIDSVL